MEFSKVLARYYHGWFRDCHDSATYCEQRGDIVRAEQYLSDARQYLDLIINNWDAVEFFSNDHTPFLADSALPEKFRGYK